MTSEPDDPRDRETSAVALIFHMHDAAWEDRLVKLLQDADMETFRTKLIAEHKRRLDEFNAWYPGECERIKEQSLLQKDAQPAPGSIAAEDMNASNDE